MDRPTGPLDSADLTFDIIDGWAQGVPITGIHAETYVLGTVGPTPMWLARFAIREVGTTWPMADVGRALGVRANVVRDSAKRLERFGMAALLGGPDHYVLQVARFVQPVTPDRPTLPPQLRDRLIYAAVTA